MGTERHTLHELTSETEDESAYEPAAPGWFAVTRGAAFFVGGVTLLNLLAEMRFPHFNAAAWWLDLQPLPKPAARGFLALTSVLLLLFSFFPRAAPMLRRLGALCTLGLLGVTFWNIWRFYHHIIGGPPITEVAIPITVHVAGSLIVVVPGLLAPGWERSNFFKDFLIGSLTVTTCLAGFPLAQFVCLGRTDERCAADAVVVFADAAEAGTGSNSLADQVRAACSLYRDGKAHKVVLAGRGESSEETQNAMQRLATEEKVPKGDLVLSSPVNDMEASVTATAKLLEEQKLAKVLIAAPFYQLPRLKLCCQRAGLDVHTVPIHDKIRLQELRPTLAREAVALWLCYLQPVLM
jgi:uncharacterized SAM-binding protein YcdF (DUF218 family)